MLTAVKEWPGSGGASGEVGVPAILDGRCARRLLDQAAGTEECSAGAEPKNGKQGMTRMQVPARRQRAANGAIPFAELRARCRVRATTLYQRLAALAATGRVTKTDAGYRLANR